MIPCLLLLPAALLLDILFGDPPNRRHPVCLIGWCARRLEPAARRLWGGSFKAGMLAALGVCAAAGMRAISALSSLFHAFLPDGISLATVDSRRSGRLHLHGSARTGGTCGAGGLRPAQRKRRRSAASRLHDRGARHGTAGLPRRGAGPPSKAWRKI